MSAGTDNHSPITYWLQSMLVASGWKQIAYPATLSVLWHEFDGHRNAW